MRLEKRATCHRQRRSAIHVEAVFKSHITFANTRGAACCAAEPSAPSVPCPTSIAPTPLEL